MILDTLESNKHTRTCTHQAFPLLCFRDTCQLDRIFLHSYLQTTHSSAAVDTEYAVAWCIHQVAGRAPDLWWPACVDTTQAAQGQRWPCQRASGFLRVTCHQNSCVELRWNRQTGINQKHSYTNVIQPQLHEIFNYIDICVASCAAVIMQNQLHVLKVNCDKKQDELEWYR